VESDDLVARALAVLLEQGVTADRRVTGVWVFGSHARGMAHSGSDLDIAVLCEPALELDRFRLMDTLARRLERDVDVIDLDTASPTLVWEVLTTGRLIFQSDALGVEAFVRHARFAAEDAEQRDRMILLAQIAPEGGA